MAIREVRKIGDEILGKQCKEVKKMTIRTKILIGDMLDTMYEKMGVGLAAPQVGILKQIVVIDVGEGPIVLINPEIIETSGDTSRLLENLLLSIHQRRLARRFVSYIAGMVKES